TTPIVALNDTIRDLGRWLWSARQVAPLEASIHKRGGIVYQPKGLEIHGFGGSDSANTMMLEARNAVRVDISNFLGVSAALLDGNGGGNADVYQNAVDERNETLELSLKTWTEPIADRLSQDDVTPPGVKITVDYSSFRAQVSGKTNHESTVSTDV
ncbi:hypothetical protein, partial [Arthrobacter sp. Soil762]|uniref:hypothetical protein n=1 Tax=Arthrobacter sp. Soil762 TaxID=1736401 RepID=UPI000B1A5DB9